MRSLADTLERLAALQKGHVRPLGSLQPSTRLEVLDDFGSNPGQLRALSYRPTGAARGAPLVLVLHGCTQDAAGYDHAAGWSTLADRHGFALLFAEQQQANNPNRCFNWFVPADIRRGEGEVESISQMVRAAISRGRLDDRRVFVTGLSAGGAMTAAMLATYPELFAGGAVIAGLPFGCAASVPEALDRMRGHAAWSVDLATEAVRAAAPPSDRPWPRLSFWHGTADQTVNPVNMERLIGQWRSHYRLRARPDRDQMLGADRRRVWLGADGRALIEAISVAGLGHGTPIGPRGGAESGVEAPFMLASALASSAHIARFWGIAPALPSGAASADDEAFPAHAAGQG